MNHKETFYFCNLLIYSFALEGVLTIRSTETIPDVQLLHVSNVVIDSMKIEQFKEIVNPTTPPTIKATF